MKKQFFIPACVLAAAAIGFAIYTAGHPELSFPWSIQITHILYGLYVDAVVLLFVLAFWKNATCLNVLTLLFELGAVFFLVQSVIAVFPKGWFNWYLPLALALNCVAQFLNTVQRRKQQRKEKAKEYKGTEKSWLVQHRRRSLFRNRQLRSFYRGRMAFGWVFAILTAAQPLLAWMNYILSKKTN